MRITVLLLLQQLYGDCASACAGRYGQGHQDTDICRRRLEAGAYALA